CPRTFSATGRRPPRPRRRSRRMASRPATRTRRRRSTRSPRSRSPRPKSPRRSPPRRRSTTVPRSPPSRTSPPPSPRRLPPKSPPPRKTPASRRPPQRLTSSSSPRRPVSVAITGGIGTGKSTALKLFARHGAATVSSDDIVHNLLHSDEEVRRELIATLGEAIVGDDGEIDRRKVGALVFKDRDLLLWLGQLLHPRGARESLAWREQRAQRPTPPRVCVTEVPLLYEAGGEERFDVVVALTASPRIRERRGRPVPEDR